MESPVYRPSGSGSVQSASDWSRDVGGDGSSFRSFLVLVFVLDGQQLSLQCVLFKRCKSV